jgi:N-carbamoylputrescine amidase
MKVTVCELPADMGELSDGWDRLVTHTRKQETDLLLLPEMPFFTWLAAEKQVDADRWKESVEAHDRWTKRFADLGAAMVLGSRPTLIRGKRLNEAFVWEDGECRGAHQKYYLPDEDGFWEATWYSRGKREFATTETAAGSVGFLICTEVWFTEHAREYSKQDAVVVATPRATEFSSRDKWLAGGRAAAVMSGAFSLSSNRSGTDATGLRWGGLGWVIDPDGQVLATTSEGSPCATVEIDTLDSVRAKATYPRYVAD